jgi:hypothetical protein
MFVLRAYLVVAGGLVLVRIVQLATSQGWRGRVARLGREARSLAA